MARPKSKIKKILFAVEIIVLLLFIGGLYVYGQLNSKLDKINQPVLDDSKIKVNQEVQDSIDSQESTLTGYTTYALFGIDHRDKNTALGGENSDTIIIASVNNDTKDVKLVSVYRDTLLNLGNDTYSKANAAYAYGEAEQAITMLNTNLDLNISEYATVNFNALTTIIDDLGGLDMDMSYAEIVHMNNYCVETSEETGKDYTPIELPDRPDDIEAVQYHYHLNGVQATSYCRIRYTASLDMGRTERQRRVIQMIVSKAKSAGLGKIFKIMDDVFPMVTTSMTKDEILQLLPTLIGYSVDDTTGFPSSFKFSNVKGSIIVPTTLESNVIELHKFLYGDETYTPSATVLANSEKILEIVGGESSLDDKQATVEENTANDTVIFEKNGSGWSDTSNNYDSDDSGSADSSDGSSGGGNTDYDPDNSGGSSSGDDGSGGDTTGGDTSGDDGSGGDTTGGDTSGGDDGSGGDTTGGDTSGGDDGSGDYVDEGSGDDGGASSEAAAEADPSAA
ncbi:LytR family transcriptional regulator [Blautia obeum]|uniref:LytR family transcriptional regulator n=1 Tax=Blautia obeum TaxID=40520 RepID=A0A414I700_9FIRM|nr:LCP family protein [Blautia obeum]RGI91622.1 LytR family transcriptional regulator [Blautia obeum]RHE11761.1 LytR family transcriptional regulator [Blautia obeum]VUX12344.1 Putative transcriptional regulator YvhJ [Blautia obeum]